MNNEFLEIISSEVGIYNLFKSVNGVGNYNCFFLAYNDTTVNTTPYILGGAVGALGAYAAGVKSGMQSKYPAYLINQTENGIGFIPLSSNKILNNLKNFQPNLAAFTFIGQNYIENITIKNYAIINSRLKRMTIKVQNSNPLHLMVNVKEKLIPYHEKNFSTFMNKYIIKK